MIPHIDILSLTVKLGAKTGAHRFVDFDGTAPTAGGAALGVTKNGGEVNDAVAVTTLGVMPAVASAAVAVGDGLEVLADGRVKKVTAGKVTVARALTAAAAANDEIRVLLVPN